MYYSGNWEATVCGGTMPYTKTVSTDEKFSISVTRIAQTSNEDKRTVSNIKR